VRYMGSMWGFFGCQDSVDFLVGFGIFLSFQMVGEWTRCSFWELKSFYMWCPYNGVGPYFGD